MFLNKKSRSKIKKVITECFTCQTMKSNRQKRKMQIGGNFDTKIKGRLNRFYLTGAFESKTGL
jgi:hypothetical protein